MFRYRVVRGAVVCGILLSGASSFAQESIAGHEVENDSFAKADVSDEQLDEALAEAESSSKPWLDIDEPQADWIRTTSGEWLKGEIKDMRDGTLSFDSDEFDLQTLDWEDIDQIHSPNAFVYVLEDQRVIIGTAEMRAGSILITGSGGLYVIEAKDIMTVAPSHVKEISHWSYNLTVGATARRGNTQSVDYTAWSRLRREDAFNRATLEYTGAYGLVRREENTNKHLGTGVWNIYISPVFYLTPVWTSGLYDKFQNIQFRGVAATGGGVHLLDKSNIEIDVDLVGGYVNTTYISVDTAVDDKSSQGVAVLPQLHIDWDITDDVEFEGLWQSALVLNDIGRSFHHATARFDVEVTDVIDLSASAIYDRQESPVADEDGEVPLRDDLALTLGLGLEFD